MSTQRNAVAGRFERSGAKATAEAAFLEAVQLLRTGEIAAAEASYTVCIAHDPSHAEAHRHLGLLLAKRGDVAGATRQLGRAVELRPDHAESRSNLGLVLRQAGQTQEAVEATRTSVDLRPGSAAAQHQFGLALFQDGKIEEAAKAFALAATLDPTSPAPRLMQAEALRKLGRIEQAMTACQQGLTIDPRNAEGLNCRGLLREQQGEIALALVDFNAALRSVPADAVVLSNIAHLHIKQRRLPEALAAVERALAFDPTNSAALGNLGAIQHREGRVLEAVATYQRAIELAPTCAQHFSNLGALLVAIDHPDEAIAACRIAVSLAPTDPAPQFNLAVALRQKGMRAEAIAAYRSAHEKGCAEALVDLCHLRRQICDWTGLAADQAESERSTYRLGLRVAPFSVLVATPSAVEQRLVAETYAASFPSPDRPLASYAPRPLARRGDRIRVGYLSSDFCQHATASLVGEMLETHDRSRFKVHAYCYGVDDGSPLRQRCIEAVEHFTELRTMSHEEAARRIASDGIDILIDLKGYTEGARTEILVFRPSPIQLNFLGYPGTMGAPFIDYVIGDPVVTPMAHAAQFSEHIVQLPHCYQPNDSARPVAPLTKSRADFGLPETGFVFCSFNNTYKITPDMFDVWMRLLHAVPHAVLWLLDTSEAGVANLRAEARARGIVPERLVFAPRIRADHHIARMALADLFLDTSPCGAHTTASEALWVGLPVLTCAGEVFASRVAASLLLAVGLPELVTPTIDDYEEAALALVRDPNRLADLRGRLHANRLPAPLFDSARYVGNFEAALVQMTAIRDAGLPPAPFKVADQTNGRRRC